MKKPEIKLQIELDDKNVPEKIEWTSTDGESLEILPAKALFLALWDAQYKNSMRIDLWTKDMPYDEMKRFFYETLQTLGDSFLSFLRWRPHQLRKSLATCGIIVRIMPIKWR